MSTAVLPTLIGLMFPVSHEIMFDTDVQRSISGKTNRLAYYTYPIHTWSADYSILRSSAAFTEYQTLTGFYSQRQGGFDSFLYQDPDFNSVTEQAIATGDGVTTTFQLLQSWGGFVEPCLAPNTGGTIDIYLNGVLDSSANYTINGWGTSNAAGPGTIIFNTAPSNTVAITGTYTYYYPCRFVNDKQSFGLFNYQKYNAKKFSWESLKN